MRRCRAVLAAAVVLLCWGFLVPGPGPAAAQGTFVLVVHSSNPVEQVTADQVTDLFLKKTKSWSHGEAVEPVDQTASSAVRIAFSRQVLDKEVPWIKGFWQKQIFSGRATPPPELAGDAEVVQFVGRSAGAIGYVRAGTALGSQVKAVRLVGGNGA
jgi:ABC-type phosphate transport system substrate-binding protein